MWCNLSLRKSIILYISAFVILAILLSAGTATLCNNATKTIESKYPPTGEKYYLTNENGERLGDGNYIGVAPVAMSEKDQRLLSICEVAPIIATPIYSALCIITATLLFYRNKLKKPLTELKAASEMISNNNLNFSIKYDSKDLKQCVLPLLIISLKCGGKWKNENNLMLLLLTIYVLHLPY